MTTTRYAAVIGTFDGVHTGHRYLLADLRDRAAALGLSTCACTFTDHPLATLRPQSAPPMLTTPAEKLSMLRALGIDRIDITPFVDVASMTARRYITQLASKGVRLILIGHDNRFGSDGLKTLQQFIDAARDTGVTIEQAVELTTPDGCDINSSRIRSLLAQGRLTQANELLGYRYRITGTVVKGKQLGRTIGFPTANLQPSAADRKVIPANGVYACLATVDGMSLPAMVNIGHRPTVDTADAPISIEAHLIDCDQDLYDHTLTLEFIERLRDEQRHPTLDALRAQLERDRAATLAATSLK